jgi:hypothetical protein
MVYSNLRLLIEYAGVSAAFSRSELIDPELGRNPDLREWLMLWVLVFSNHHFSLDEPYRHKGPGRSSR